MKVRTSYSGTDYVIPGKFYDVVSRKSVTAEVYLENADENHPDVIYLNGLCAHLNVEASWKIIEED